MTRGLCSSPHDGFNAPARAPPARKPPRAVAAWTDCSPLARWLLIASAPASAPARDSLAHRLHSAGAAAAAAASPLTALGSVRSDLSTQRENVTDYGRSMSAVTATVRARHYVFC